MSSSSPTVKVVIPLYREQLPELELRLLRHNLNVLAQYKITFLIPEGLNIESLRDEVELDRYDHEVLSVSDEWLGRKNGIAGYNRMMLSFDFYALFSDVDYILVCHTDAYIFRDDLRKWLDKGYDYIGAPWVKRPLYDNPISKLYLSMRLNIHRRFRGDERRFLRQELFNHVGNGGLSLRRVESFKEACVTYRDKIKQMLSVQNHLGNEDVFWALVPFGFRYPDFMEALRFSIDTRPKLSLLRSKSELPFGCHGLTRASIFKFWRDKIELS